ncbi:MAG: nucleotidyl transferase AbiEii/AbiGii toxin family protein [Candidatus Micrarchaeota archaeon]
MISPNVISEISKKEGISWGVVEKDYFITLLLEAISNESFLKTNFVFKGGTALRKIYFKDYRYSEDLDFTLRKELSAREIRSSVEASLEFLKTEHNADLRIKNFNSKSYFTDVKIQFVGFKGNKNSIALDLTPNEVIVDVVTDKLVFNSYYSKDFSVNCYSLGEIFAEKLRSLLQRTRVRDYYDVWYLLKHAQNNLDKKKISQIFQAKVLYKKLAYTDKSQLLDPVKLEQVKAYYSSQLENQLSNLPSFEQIESDLKKAINKLDLHLDDPVTSDTPGV